MLKAGNIEEVYGWYRAAEKFVEYEDFEDAAAISTMYSAFEIIVFEYSRVLLQSQRRSSAKKNAVAEKGNAQLAEPNPDAEQQPVNDAPQLYR